MARIEIEVDDAVVDQAGYAEALAAAGRLLGASTVREIAEVAGMPRAARDAFFDGLHDALEWSGQVARGDA